MAHITGSGILPLSSLVKRITPHAELYPIVSISAPLRAEDVTTNTIKYGMPKKNIRLYSPSIKLEMKPQPLNSTPAATPRKKAYIALDRIAP